MVTARFTWSPSAGSRVCEWAMVYTLGDATARGLQGIFPPVKESYGLLETH